MGYSIFSTFYYIFVYFYVKKYSKIIQNILCFMEKVAAHKFEMTQD